MEAAQFEPMGIGKILDKACRLYRENFLRFLAIVAIIKIPLMLIMIVWQKTLINSVYGDNSGQPPTLLILIGNLVVIFVFSIAQTLCTATLTKSVSGSYLNENITVGKAYQKNCDPDSCEYSGRLVCRIWLHVISGTRNYFRLMVNVDQPSDRPGRWWRRCGHGKK